MSDVAVPANVASVMDDGGFAAAAQQLRAEPIVEVAPQAPQAVVPPPTPAGAPFAQEAAPAPAPEAPLDVNLLNEIMSGLDAGPAQVESAPAPAPSALAPAPAPFDMQRFLEAQQARDERLLQALRPPAPPAAEPDIALELPENMRTPENIETYKVFRKLADERAEAKLKPYQQQQEEAAFQGQVQAAQANAGQTAAHVARQLGINPATPGGQKFLKNVSTMGLALSAARGGNPSDHLAEIHSTLRETVREVIASRAQTARSRTQMQAPTGMAPPVTGAPGSPPPAQASVPTEAQAVALGYPNVFAWYKHNVLGQPR